MSSVLTGCAVDQKKEVKRYRDVIDLPPATQPHEQASLSLRDALLIANARNEQLAQQGETYLRTLIERQRAVAGFLPSLSLVPRYVRRESVGGGGSITDADGSVISSGNDSGGTDRSFDAPLQASINLFNGFRDVNRYWADTLRIEAAKATLVNYQEDLLLDVAESYFNVLRAESQVGVLESSLAVQEERLRDTRGRLAAGVARPLDVAQTEAQTASTRVTLVNARRDVATARSLLTLLLGGDAAARRLTTDYTLPDSITPIEDYLALARRRRSDLIAADAAVGAARRDVEVAFGQYYPSVSLDFTNYLYRETPPTARTWEGFLEANIPIFSAGLIEADVREAWSFFREAQLVRAYLSREIRQQIEQAFGDLLSSNVRLVELRVQVAAAEAAFLQAEASYRFGRATNLDRVTAQTALLEAQLLLSNEEFDRSVFYLRLLRNAGVIRSTVVESQQRDAVVRDQTSDRSGDSSNDSVSDTTAATSIPLLPASRPTTQTLTTSPAVP